MNLLSRLTGSTFTSLRVRNYRVYFLVQVVSANGTWIQMVGQFWLVLHLTGSGVALGLTAALQQLPNLLFASYGGLIADRVDKRRLLMVTQSASGVLGLVLAALTFTGIVNLWMIYGLALALGVVNVFDLPARQSFVMEMVGPRQVANGVALNTAVITSARMIGPAVAGLLIATIGTGFCFLYNGLSFFAMVGGLMLMRPSELHLRAPLIRARGQIKEGFVYVWSRPELRYPLMLAMVMGTFALNWNVTLPLVARYTFHGGADTYGLMLSMMGIGALGGALLSAGRSRPTHALFAQSAVAFGLVLVAAGVAWSPVVLMLVLVPVGALMSTCLATCNALLQLGSPVAFRGRVMALYIVAIGGTTPIGGPIVGWVSTQFGGRVGLAMGGAVTLVAAAALLRPMRRLTRDEPKREPEFQPATA